MGDRAKDPGAGTGLCLVAEARDDPGWHELVAAVLDAARAATLVVTAPEGAALASAAARPLVELAQRKKIAALIVDDPAAARETGADGVHLTPRPDIADACRAARAALGTQAIVGADAGASRHDAMLLGEAGADYVAFGRLPRDADSETAHTQRELVAWWAEIFVVPVVAFGIETPEEAAALARAGADFVAVRMPRDGSAESWAAAMAAALAAPADAA